MRSVTLLALELFVNPRFLLMQKYLLFLFSLFLITGAIAQGKSRGSEADEKMVRIAHQEDFPEAQQVRFATEDTGYVFSFVHNGYTMVARYSFDAELKYQEFVVPKDRYTDLENIRKHLNQQYPNHRLIDLFLCDAGQLKYYRADFQYRGRNQRLRFDLDGTPLE